MSDRPSWMPSDEEIRISVHESYLALTKPELAGTDWLQSHFHDAAEYAIRRFLDTKIRAAVEKALAEQRETWIAALKTASGEYRCHPDFAEMWARAEADPTYWAELLRSSRDAYHKQDARHAREVERARLEGKIEELDNATATVCQGCAEGMDYFPGDGTHRQQTSDGDCEGGPCTCHELADRLHGLRAALAALDKEGDRE